MVHQASTLMEFMSTYPDGQILILVKQGSLSSLGKTGNQLLFILEVVAMIFLLLDIYPI